jgi:hypothetical protein
MSVITIWYSRVRIFDRPSCADVAVSTSNPDISSTAFIVNSTATSSSTSNTLRFGKSNLQGSLHPQRASGTQIQVPVIRLIFSATLTAAQASSASRRIRLSRNLYRARR